MVFVAHIVDLFWLIMPSFYPDGIQVSWIDFAALLGVGGVWLAMFIALLKRRPLLARNDPRLLYPVHRLLPMENSAHPQTTGPAPRGGIDPSDVSFKGVVYFLIGLVISLVIIHFVIGYMFGKLTEGAQRRDHEIMRTLPVPAVAASHPYFPEPREQISPRLDLQALRAREEAELNSYGWIDKKAGVVRIPIERALDLIAQRGLPASNGTNRNQAGPSSLQLQQARPIESTPPNKEQGR